MPDVNAAPNPALEEMLEEDCPIAVIAAACRMPGAPDPATFWQRIFEGQDFTRRFTPEELAEAGIDAATAARPDYVGVGAVLDDAFDFDPAFFGYSAAEALDIDPQQRLFLACAAEALQVAGHGGRAPRGSVGVFGATRLSTWMRPDRDMLLRIASPRNFQALTGNDKDYLATRVAYKLDLSGPALTVQTACSSSLVAVHMACEQLRAGGCDMALAGGVGITFPQALGYLHRDGMIFSADGSCRPFSAEANGTGIGHGCGVVLLKRLADAEADGDEIWAVVRGSAVNNDGAAKAGFTRAGHRRTGGGDRRGPGHGGHRPRNDRPGGSAWHRHAARRPHRGGGADASLAPVHRCRPALRAGLGEVESRPSRHGGGHCELPEGRPGAAPPRAAADAVCRDAPTPRWNWTPAPSSCPSSRCPGTATGRAARPSAPSASAARTATSCWRKRRPVRLPPPPHPPLPWRCRPSAPRASRAMPRGSPPDWMRPTLVPRYWPPPWRITGRRRGRATSSVPWSVPRRRMRCRRNSRRWPGVWCPPSSCAATRGRCA
jgi:3-oxoacyl-(acyl-carrier-protein) synthase